MSSPRYIEVTSSNRNRLNYPCPADFVVPADCINRGDNSGLAKDRIVSGYPFNAWYQVPYAAPSTEDGSIMPRRVNGIYYTSLWPLARNPDNPSIQGSGRVMAMKFAGGTSGAPKLSSTLTFPPNEWIAKSPPEENIVLNPFYTPTSNYLAGALLLKFDSDPSVALNSGDMSWEGICESSVIVGYDSKTGTVFLETPFTQDIRTSDYFLVDFNTDPSNAWGDFVNGGARIFIPNGSTGQNAYAGMYVQNYTWTKNGLDNDDYSGFAKVTRYDERRRIAYLSKPIPLVEQLACAEEGTPYSFYGSNTFTLRDSIPTICRSLSRLGISNGSVGEINILEVGREYKLGDIIASRDFTDGRTVSFSQPGKKNKESIEAQYVLRGPGSCFRARVTSTDTLGGVLSLEILQQGHSFLVSEVYETDINRDPMVTNKGTGTGFSFQLPQVFQSVEVYARWPGDNMTTVNAGDFVFLPTIGQIKNDGTPNYDTKTTPPAMPRYSYTPSTANQECPVTNYKNLDIRTSGYPARIDCVPETGQHIFPFSGTMRIAKVFRKTSTFHSMWESVPSYPEEDAEGPLTVLLLDGGFDMRDTGLTDWGLPAFVPSSTSPNTGVLREQDLEILRFVGDNEHALNYSGSTVSQNQMVCYAISLNSLTLPNIALRNEIGGLIAFYPYVYVELSNVTAPSSGNRGIIYSNNPNANRALFRVTVDDQNTPLRSRFIKLDGGGAIQTVKFKPNDDLRFRVFFQNSMLFQTEQQDFAPPLPPDFFVQIGACFGIRRL